MLSIMNEIDPCLSLPLCVLYRIQNQIFQHLCPPIKCEANWALNSLKELIELGINLLNQILTSPFSVVRKALHMISSGIP